MKLPGLMYTQYGVLLVLWEKDGVSATEIGKGGCRTNGKRKTGGANENENSL